MKSNSKSIRKSKRVLVSIFKNASVAGGSRAHKKSISELRIDFFLNVSWAQCYITEINFTDFLRYINESQPQICYMYTYNGTLIARHASTLLKIIETTKRVEVMLT